MAKVSSAAAASCPLTVALQVPTPIGPRRFVSTHSISTTYLVEVMSRVTQRFSAEECARLEEMLNIVSRELMPEVQIPDVKL